MQLAHQNGKLTLFSMGQVGSPSHPAWATEYDVDANTFRAMDVVTNSFCAGGGVLGNGTWLNVGGNQGTRFPHLCSGIT